MSKNMEVRICRTAFVHLSSTLSIAITQWRLHEEAMCLDELVVFCSCCMYPMLSGDGAVWKQQCFSHTWSRFFAPVPDDAVPYAASIHGRWHSARV